MKGQRITDSPVKDYRTGKPERRRATHATLMGIMLTGIFLIFACNVQSSELDKSLSKAISQQLEGLWAYESLKPSRGDEFLLTGYFIFHDGYFLQQSINDGDPFESQGGMAHAGPYMKADKGYRMVAEIGISTMPTRTPPLSVRLDTQHEIFPEFSDGKLVLTFGSGTVQIFRRIDTKERQIHKLDKGYLAFADHYFILVTAWEENTVAGTGTYEKEGNSLRLHAERWFSVLKGKANNIKDQTIDATFDGETFKMPNGVEFHTTK